MKRIVVITLAVAVPVFLSTRVVFPPSADEPEPQGVQLPLLMGVGVFEALALGLAVAMLVAAPTVIRSLDEGYRPSAWVLTGVAAWLLGNWWVHDNLHRVVGMNLDGLIALEYGFHVTLMLGGGAAVVALAHLARLVGRNADTGQSVNASR